MGARDFQRSKVYAAELALTRKLRDRLVPIFLPDIDAVVGFVYTITSSPWWKHNCPPRRRVRIVAARKNAKTSTVFPWGEIRLIAAHYDLVSIIHELCHLTVPWDSETASHGRQFCRHMLEMTSRFIGSWAKEMLSDEYRSQGVKWHKKRNLSPEQRQAMAERARANFGLTS